MAMNRDRMNQAAADAAVTHRWPAPSDVDLRDVVLSYDRHSDTLFVHLFGRGRPAVSDLVGDSWYLLVDPQTLEVVGLQIEDFLARAVAEAPPLVDLLDLSELRGITPAEVRRERHRIMHGYRQGRQGKPTRWFLPARRKRAAVEQMLEWRSPFTIGSTAA